MNANFTKMMDSKHSITVRFAQRNDAERIAVLCHELGYPNSHEEVEQRIQQILKNNQHVVYVALLKSGDVIGWIHGHLCELVITSPQVMILGLIIARNYRGRGIGRRLMQQIEQWSLDKNCCHILVRSNVIRKEAHRFYESIGYTNVKQSQVFSKTLLSQL
jgi:GNAT superfamily N-acetyltransferase